MYLDSEIMKLYFGESGDGDSRQNERIVSLRQEIWDKRNEFARRNYGEYPDSVIISGDVNTALLIDCEMMAKQELVNVGLYMGMEISVLADPRKEKIVKVAKASN